MSCSQTTSAYPASNMSAPLSTSTNSCGTNCPCRTVSSVGSTTPRVVQVQLDPYVRSPYTDPPSPDSSNEDLPGHWSTPTNDTFKQDFQFDDVFEYDNDSNRSTNDDLNEGDGLTKKGGSQAEFSFSHYSAYTKTAGSTKLVRTKSGHVMPRHVRVKSGTRRGG